MDTSQNSSCNYSTSFSLFQFVVLDSVDNSNKRIIVANTHQYFHPDADHIRLLQTSMTLTYLEHLVAETTAEVSRMCRHSPTYAILNEAVLDLRSLSMFKF
jgi:mRNA deadenylase 3'-5' endonuclease subunit Ccr4